MAIGAKRKAVLKFPHNKSGNEGSLRKRRSVVPRSPKKGTSPKPNIKLAQSPIISCVITYKQKKVHYFIITILVYSKSFTVGSNSPYLWV